jgi:hypothetical protein
VSVLPQLWEESGEEHLMKQTILGLLSRLFRSMGGEGVRLQGSILPLIHSTLAPGSTLREVLLEDSIELWCDMVQQTPTPAAESELDPQLVSLLEYLIPLLDHDTETLEKTIEILQAYILLAPTVTLSRDFFPKVLEVFKNKLATNRAGHFGFIVNSVENAWQAGVAVQGQAGAQEMILQYLSTGFLDQLINGLKESWEAHQTTGPKATVTKIQGLIETDYLSILSRMVYDAPELFIEAMQKSQSLNSPPTKAKTSSHQTTPSIDWLLEEWLSHGQDFGDPDRHKLLSMAFARFLDMPQPFLLGHMQTLLDVWTNTVTEIRSDELDGPNAPEDTLIWKSDEVDDESLLTNKTSSNDKRARQLNRLDPVHQINLMSLIREVLGRFIQRCGGEQQFQSEVLVNIDKKVLDGFAALNIM